MRYGAIVCAAAVLWTGSAWAKVQGRDVTYRQGQAVLEGYVAYDDAVSGKRPGIVVIHDWKGVSAQTKIRTDALAGLGYVGFAADIYGKGIRPQTVEAAQQQAGIFRADRKLMRARAQAALSELKKMEQVDPRKLGVMGYCFGGGASLELARSGADLAGVVSFHGNLDTPDPRDGQRIKAKVLVLHGAEDPFVPPAQIAAFHDEMRQARLDWQMVYYGGAVHSFTIPDAGSDTATGSAYDAKADRRSWEAMKDFWNEVFSSSLGTSR